MKSKNDFFEMNLDDIDKVESGGNRPLVLEEGDTVLRVLPPWREGAMYLKKYKMHFSLADLREYGLKTDGWYAEPCLAERVVVDDTTARVVTGQPCPICEIANKAWQIGNRTKDGEVLEIAKKIRAKTQFVSNVIDMGNVSAGVQRYCYGKKINDSLKAFLRKKGDITNPHTGRAICITKSKIPGQNWPEYGVMLEDEADLGEVWGDIKDSLFDLDYFPEYSTFDDLEKRIQGVSFSFDVGQNVAHKSNGAIELSSNEDVSLDELLEG